ncbi:MAG: hypothetical protein II471_04815, partial [Bacteroidales bacterium]|nr:hypothetical protein [Bacteroidales bacterium]
HIISDPPFPEPCPVCGHLPCTCDGGRQKKTIKVKLSKRRELTLKTNWTEKFQYGEDLISIEQFIEILFGRLPEFFKSAEDLRKQWEHPDTRAALLDHLDREGFAEEKLRMMQRVIDREDCDLLDVLEFLAYETTPLERQKRIELVKADYYKKQNEVTKKFLDFLMNQYILNGEHQFTMDNLPTLLNMQYGTAYNATQELNMNAAQIRQQYLDFQHELYRYLA